MGCDGGTIPKRDELVRTKKKPEKVGRLLVLSQPSQANYLNKSFKRCS